MKPKKVGISLSNAYALFGALPIVVSRGLGPARERRGLGMMVLQAPN